MEIFVIIQKRRKCSIDVQVLLKDSFLRILLQSMCNPSFVASEKLLQLLRLLQHFIQISATWDFISLLHCWPRRHSLVPNLQGRKLCEINLREFFSMLAEFINNPIKPERGK